MTIASNITGASISAIPTWDNQFAVRGRQMVHFRDLVRTIDTTTGLYIFLRQNIPAGEGSVAATTQPGATKTKRDYDNTMVTVTSRYRAGTVDVAAEMIQDIPGLSQYITEELTEDYLRTESFDFFDSLINAATGSSAVPAGVTVTAERIPHYIANLESNNYQPTDIVVRPRAWANLINTKPADYSTPGGYIVLPDGTILFAGLRLTKCSSNALADDEVLIGDFRKTLITQKAGEGFNVRMFNTHDQAVYANLITFRGEARAEVAILRPDAFLVGGA
jgi:HK97 family phage major capsid protein